MTDCVSVSKSAFQELHVNYTVCVQPWFPQQTQLSGPLDSVYATVTLFQDPVLFKRSDKVSIGILTKRRAGVSGEQGERQISTDQHTHLKHGAVLTQLGRH